MRRTISVRLLADDNLQIGDWVLVHVGFAMAKIDEHEAKLTLDQVQKMGADYTNEIEAFNCIRNRLRGRCTMKFVDEFRDPAAARALVKSITELATGGEFKFMEVCGGHTHTIYRHGIEHLLPEEVELVHGPGCPVCVIPMGRVDDAMWLAEQPGVIFTTFGDMMRVPGSKGNLIEAKARGADVRFVYSPLDALKVAVDNPDRHVVFFAVGFETTAPSTAVTLGPGPSTRREELQRLLQPRHDRSADQGHPRIARPAAVGVPGARPRVDGGGAAAVSVRH